MSAPRPAPKPWPMKWIVLVIVLSLGAYTWLTLHYRKVNPAFAPYGDMKDRANTHRLLAAGFQRISLRVERPADPRPAAGDAVITAAAPGLPEDLRATLLDLPVLPADYERVAAADAINAFFPYLIEFSELSTDHRYQPGPAMIYLREGELIIVPELEKLSGDLQARGRDNRVRLTIPAGALKPGQYAVRLVGARSSQAWTLQVH
ncbi:MAG: hypothetical protein KIT44_02070 [Opitutaceae bacterium]|nr:hypothetical protein [Opitutaceae bacterium]